MENESLGQAPWSLIEPHARRDAVIVVAPRLSIETAAEAVAQDDQARVGGWIQSGDLAKPSAEQLASWRGEPDRLFKSVVVQPYVLIQEILNA